MNKETHEKQCEFVFELCQYCLQNYRRNEMQPHIQECPIFPLECRYCFQEHIRQVLENHEQHCLERTIECESCFQMIKLKEKGSTHNCVSYIVSVMKELKEENTQMRQQLQVLNTSVARVNLKYNFYGEEWNLLLQVGKQEDFDFESDFWVKEEPLNMLSIQSGDFDKTYKT